MDEARDGRDQVYSRREDGEVVHFQPLQIEQIYAANTITPQELAKLQANERRKPIRHLLPRYEYLATKSSAPMPPQIEEWLELTRKPRPWLVVCEPNQNIAGTIAGRILIDPRLNYIGEGAMLNVADFAEECSSSSRFGPGSIGDVIAKWADHQLLALTGVGAESMPSSAPLTYELTRLLERRLDRLLPTALIEQSPGSIWLSDLRKAGASAANVNHLRDIIWVGMNL